MISVEAVGRKNMSKVKAKPLIPANPLYHGWKHFGDMNDGVHVFCLLCAVDGTEKTSR